MLCCSCHTGTMLPTRIDQGPAGYLCNQCGGALLSIAPYLDWVRSQAASTDFNVDSRPVQSETVAEFEGAAHDTKRALGCPKCSRLMLRFNVLADKAHGLDFCFHCEEVWLDSGEWQYLKSLGLHTAITRISTDPYQRRLREQAAEESAQQRFRSLIGDESFGEAQRFAAWLKEQPG